MTCPVIGLTTNYGKNEYGHPTIYLLRAYGTAILEAGGAPILIPSDLPQPAREALYPRLDGILFTGGGDISIERFNGEPHPRIENVQPERDEIEFVLLDTAVKDGKPFLGICRGFQVVIVGLGGTLYAHIEDQMPQAIKHDYFPNYPRNYLAHQVRIEAGTRLADILGEATLSVNSLHHQGAKDVPTALAKVGFAPDGLLEAIELSGHPFGFAVQWHPEWLTDQPVTKRLFQAFIEAARVHQ